MGHLTFRYEPFADVADSYYPPPKGQIVAYIDGERVGFLQFYRKEDEHPQSVHTEYLMVFPKWRGHGIGAEILRQFKRWLRRNSPWTVYAFAEETSQGALNLKNRIYGPPLHLDDGIRNLSVQEALKYLPAKMQTTREGNVEADRKVFSVHWVGPRRAPQGHPWADE